MDRFKAFATGVVELYRKFQKAKDAAMKKFGLRATHTMCLYYLGQHAEGLTASTLTKRCGEDKAAVSRTLAGLTKKELVFAAPVPGKKSRRALYFLTEKGKDVVREMNADIDLAMKNCSDGLSDGEKESFFRSMEVITKNLSDYSEKKEQ